MAESINLTSATTTAMNLQPPDSGQAALGHNLAQWHAALQELYKSQGAALPATVPFANAFAPYGNIWPSQPLIAAYGSVPVYGGLFPNTVAIAPSSGPLPTLQPSVDAEPSLPSNAQQTVKAEESRGAATPSGPNRTPPPSSSQSKVPGELALTTGSKTPADPDSSPTGSPSDLSALPAMPPAPGSGVLPPGLITPGSLWLGSTNTGAHREPPEQEDKEGKKMKRKQSNRESARRSRLRKQAETEQLAKTVKELITENSQLKQSVEQLKVFVDRLVEQKQGLISQVKELGGAVHHEFEHGLLVCKLEDLAAPAVANVAPPDSPSQLDAAVAGSPK